jgi:hypothetical protein
MTRATVFWVLMLIWAVFSLAVYGGLVGGQYGLIGNRVLDFILFALLGWDVYGPMFKGKG